MKLAGGINRFVILVGGYAVKVPRVRYGWQGFLRGLLANITEGSAWRDSRYCEGGVGLRDELLCPVVWVSWGGWVLVMRRADVQRHLAEVIGSEDIGGADPEQEVMARYARWIKAGFGGDDKCENYGYLDGRLVKIDYSK